MASLNKKTIIPPIHTAEGGIAKKINYELALRRSVFSTFLWEKSFYETGIDISERIRGLIPKVSAQKVSEIAIEARTVHNLRHVPLLIVREMARIDSHKSLVSETLSKVICRPDELTEFVSIYWKDGKQALSAQVKKGLAKAFGKFNEYSLQKYNRDNDVKLRDVLFLCHAKPKDAEQEALWKRLANNELVTPDTWEVELSQSKDKRASWTRLLKENKLGAMALLKNLRNFSQNNVDVSLVKDSLKASDYSKVLPFRFISAARFAPHLETDLEVGMFKSIENSKKLSGKTIILVDKSGSMSDKISEKSDLIRLDAACGVAMIARELCEDVRVFTFNNSEKEIPNRRGFALRDVIGSPMGGTCLGNSLTNIQKICSYDRIIVITDEQTSDTLSKPLGKFNYMINVASNKNGVGYGNWIHIDGFSEGVIKYIQEIETLSED